MNKIQLIANIDTNYVFHMLSVAKCGYDNEYGEKYRNLYPQEDLAVLKKYENMITVRGGEHCGELYPLLVTEPACAKTDVKTYYSGLLGMIENNEVPEEFTKYIEPVRDISKVMIRHYDSFCSGIWGKEEQKIRSYIPEVMEKFETTGFTDMAEELVGVELPGKYFIATMVSSVKDGAEAIDISKEQDVFGIDRSPEHAFFFIGHEFIIYLLFEALKNEDAFKSVDTWKMTEGLSEFLLRQIVGQGLPWESCRDYIDLYEKWWNEGCRSVIKLYRRAIMEGK